MCEELQQDVIPPDTVNAILGAVVTCMEGTAPEQIQLGAVKAMLSIIPFARSNFDVEDQRNTIMTVCYTSASNSP